MEKAYHYDEKGYYTGEINRQLDPLESKKAGHPIYLLPASSTLVEPLAAKEGFKIKWNADASAWEYEEEKKEEPVEEYKPTKKEQLQMDINQKKWELSQTDYKALKYAEGLLTEEEYAPIKAERQAMRDEINAMEAKLSKMK